jgi:hypothetical protein
VCCCCVVVVLLLMLSVTKLPYIREAGKGGFKKHSRIR